MSLVCEDLKIAEIMTWDCKVFIRLAIGLLSYSVPPIKEISGCATA